MSQPYTMMSAIVRRIQRLEALEFQHRAKDGHRSITLEELCRLSWRRDKKEFLESAKNNSYQLFASQFEREDAEAASRDGRRFRARR
jgi:hypothetical protein